MTCFLFAFILSTAFWLALLVYGIRRVTNNMKNNPEAQHAIVRHVLTPVFGDQGVPADREGKS